MSTLKKFLTTSAVSASLVLGLAAVVQAQSLGMPVNESQLQGFDLIAQPDGSGYPAGGGTAIQGKAIFERRCAACHGINGEGTSAQTRLVGGDMQSVERPIRTVGSYWPHASTLFDYVQRAMPADAPKSLSSSEVYQVIAYVLNMNGIIEDSLVLNKETLMQVEMPNKDGFIDSSQAL